MRPTTDRKSEHLADQTCSLPHASAPSLPSALIRRDRCEVIPLSDRLRDSPGRAGPHKTWPRARAHHGLRALMRDVQLWRRVHLRAGLGGKRGAGATPVWVVMLSTSNADAGLGWVPGKDRVGGPRWARAGSNLPFRRQSIQDAPVPCDNTFLDLSEVLELGLWRAEPGRIWLVGGQGIRVSRTRTHARTGRAQGEKTPPRTGTGDPTALLLRSGL